jgi:hypothetical protein
MSSQKEEEEDIATKIWKERCPRAGIIILLCDEKGSCL